MTKIASSWLLLICYLHATGRVDCNAETEKTCAEDSTACMQDSLLLQMTSQQALKQGDDEANVDENSEEIGSIPATVSFSNARHYNFHYVDYWTKQPAVLRFRPEWAKLMRCTDEGDEKCSECEGSTDCWHNEGVGGWAARWDDKLVATASSTEWSLFRYAVHFKCPDNSKTFVPWMDFAIQGGELKLKFDGDVRFDTNTASTSFSHYVRTTDPNDKVYSYKGDAITVANPHGHTLTADFYPDYSYNGKREAKLSFFLIKMESDFAECEDLGVCLNILGTNFPEGLHLRRSNGLQLACLENPSPQGVCAQWKECLENSGKLEHTTVLLYATHSPIPTAPPATNTTNGTNGTNTTAPPAAPAHHWSAPAQGSDCLDPEIEDVQSWQCDCADWPLEVCASLSSTMSGFNQVDCMTAHFCTYPHVCEHWIDDNCNTNSVQAHISAISSHTSLTQRSSAGKANGRAETREMEETFSGGAKVCG